MTGYQYFLALGLILSSMLAAPDPVSAVCGDTNNDDVVTTTDALRTLHKAVGLPVDDLVCPLPEPVNRLAFINTIRCEEMDFLGYFTWSEHPELLWKSFTDLTLPYDPSKSKRIDDLEISGVLNFDLGPCGDVEIDLDEAGYSYFLPNNTTAALILIYQESDDSLYMFITVLSTEYPASIQGAAAISTPDTQSTIDNRSLPLGHVRAPNGISSAG